MRKNYIHIMVGSVLFLLLTASFGWAAMGEVQNFTFHGIGPEDVLGPGENATPDGKPDASFSLNLSGIGGALSGISLQSENGGSSWDTVAGNGIPGMQVKESGGKVIAESGGGMSLTPFLMGMGITFIVPDDGSIAGGGKFTVTARFVDGSESHSTISIPGTAKAVSPTAGDVEIVYARMTGKGTRDLTGRNKRLRGDGTADYGIQAVLQGTGTLTGVTVRSIEGKSAQWDTFTNSNSWLVVVMQSDKVLNKPDGSMDMQLRGKSVLDLLVTDNGAIANGKSRFEVSFTFSDGAVAARVVETEGPSSSEGTFSGSAVLSGSGTRDLAGKNEHRRGSGTNDWKVDLKVNTPGTLNGMKIENTSGSAGHWDTIPGNGRWLIVATEPNGNILNRSDGSVLIAISRETELGLWIEDNGSLGDRDVVSRITLMYDDGRTLSKEIVCRIGTDRPDRPDRGKRQDGRREVSFSGPRQASSSDYVGARERIGPDGSFDWLFEFQITGKGQVEAIMVESIGTSSGVWDTVPGNGNWALGVVLPGKGGKGLLNNYDGSVSFEVPPNHNLQVFLEDNGSLRQGASNFRISVTWSDGTVTTATS
ncbi:hypothetical protein [Aminivibrio sp.]|uniref:hypothetical protein n=1 Tax=Aminivibrio sp. TaxID=1872489 RepID=UPI001A595A6C|nr:hypothetical protein [Aminivibrio sp.]MBL3538200.1 hypothetical protein [Aminivibrio sp.]